MSHPEPIEPRPHQSAALLDLMSAFAVHDRVQLVLACGTGKTLIGRWHAQASDSRAVAVFLPSLALVAQTLREWRRPGGWDFDALVVCSDPTTSHDPDSAGEDRSVTVPPSSWTSTHAAVTTDVATAVRTINRPRGGRPLVVLSTYHSAPVVAAAQARTGLVFDLAIADEAHRLAGAPRTEFRAVLDSRQIVARHRLFLTATARDEASGFSMDDPRLFGPVAHTVGFGAAIEAGLLTDYQVLVIATRDTPTDPTTPSAAGNTSLPAALLSAIDHHNIRRILTFHTRIQRADDFARALDATHSPGGAFLRARHVNAHMPTSHRSEALRWLADTTGPQVRVLTSARCLTEGVDVPAVDAVVFADPRNSVIDIIQSIGRVLRPSPGKRRGTIIVPVTLPADGDDDTELLVSAFEPVWTVLRGLRAHDGRLAQSIDRAQRSYYRNGERRLRELGAVRFFLPPDIDDDLIRLRMVQQVGTAWERHFGALQGWAAAHRGRRLACATQHEGIRIGEWAVKQRQAYGHGVLPLDRVERLEGVPGWYWDAADAHWDDTYDLLAELAHDTGSLTENDTAPSLFDGHHTSGSPRRRLGVWAAQQRQAYRAGTLDPRRAARLEKLPDWTWTPVPHSDLEMVEALSSFVEFERHADPPDNHIEDGLPLGRWVWDIRRRKLTGVLHPALEDEIWAATPSKWARTGGRWLWHTNATQWRLAFTALRRFTEREDHACPTVTHREPLHDTTVAVGQWVALQRFKRRRDELDPTHEALLAALPGWKWDGELGATAFTDPIDLPEGLSHGRPGAVARGCGCETCILARRAYDRDWLAKRRIIADGVDATRARRKLDELDAAGAGRRLVSLATQIPFGTLRLIATGKTDQISAAHERTLLATTAQICLSHANRTGSRGRPRARAGEKIASADTVALLDDLAARGFSRPWLARELGQRTLDVRGDLVTRHMAERIADLAGRVGARRMPTVPRNKGLPTLTELLREEPAA